jgi:hypothetical protein
MKHNKEEIIPGDIVILDKEYQNSSLVKVVKISPRGMFYRVHLTELENPIDEDCWDVTISRLTKT